jgi:AcrR family transcriptional regulator
VRAKQERTQQDIVEAALRCVRHNGLSDLTVNAVAKEARLTPQSVHYYFRSREDLAAAVIKALSQRELAALLERVRDTSGPADALEALVRSIIAHYRGDLETFRARYVWPQLQGREFTYESQDVEPLTSAVLHAVEERLVRGQSDGKLAPGMDPAVTTALAWSLAYALLAREVMVQVTKYPARFSLDQMTDALCAILRRAVAKDEVAAVAAATLDGATTLA